MNFKTNLLETQQFGYKFREFSQNERTFIQILYKKYNVQFYSVIYVIFCVVFTNAVFCIRYSRAYFNVLQNKKCLPNYSLVTFVKIQNHGKN